MSEFKEGSDFKPEFKEGEKERITPTINVVRHGSTDYKELKDPNFKFDPQAADFKLDSEHLDLNEQGIREIEKAAEQLASEIDKENEVIVLMTSPNFRAHSSALVLEKVLRKKGIEVIESTAALHPGKTIRTAASLQQIKHRDDIDISTWVKKHQQLVAERPGEFKDKPSDDVHSEVATELGGSLKDWFQEDYGDLESRFIRFLRHATNIDHYLSDKTKEELQGKKLRIISISHEELPIRFFKENIGPAVTLKNGQVMELQPHDLSQTDKEVEAKVTILPKDVDDKAIITEVKVDLGLSKRE